MARLYNMPLQSLNLHPDLHIIQVHLHAVGDRVGDGQGGAEGLVTDVLLEGLQRGGDNLVVLHRDGNLVQHLKVVLLAVGLHQLHELAGITLVLQLLGDLDVQGHGERAEVGHHPAGDVLRLDLHIVGGDLHGLPFNLKVHHAFFLQLRNFLLRESGAVQPPIPCC